MTKNKNKADQKTQKIQKVLGNIIGFNSRLNGLGKVKLG
jgi:hypothetical protein